MIGGLPTSSQSLEVGLDLLAASGTSNIGKNLSVNLQYDIWKTFYASGGLRLSSFDFGLGLDSKDPQKGYQLAEYEDPIVQFHLQLGPRLLLPVASFKFNKQLGVYTEATAFFEPFPNENLGMEILEYRTSTYFVKGGLLLEGDASPQLDYGFGVGIYYKADDLYAVLRVQFSSIDPYKAFRPLVLEEQILDEHLPKAGQIAVGISVFF